MSVQPSYYRAAALAAVFVKHDHEGNEAGMQAIIDEVNRADILGEFVPALAALAVGFGRDLYGAGFPAKLQRFALDWQQEAGR